MPLSAVNIVFIADLRTGQAKARISSVVNDRLGCAHCLHPQMRFLLYLTGFCEVWFAMVQQLQSSVT